jgi:hypothetical protein
MAPSKRQLLTIVIVIIVVGAAALGLALTKFEMGQKTAEPSLPGNSTQPTQSPKTPNPTATTPTQTPPSTSTSVPTSTSPPPSSPVESSNGNFELAISVEKTVYRVGEPVNITLTITNISDQTVDFTHTGMDFDFLVQNGTDNLIYQWSIGRAFAMFISLEPLRPLENVTATYVWPQIYNNPSTTGISVSPGTYYIIGKSNSIYGLQTDPVQIVIADS